MTYKDHLWSAMYSELEKFDNQKVKKKLKRERIMKLVNYWRKAQ